VSEFTDVLNAIGQGDPSATDRLLPLVYDELRRLAAHRLAGEQPGQTLDATALVHEAYLRLVGADGGLHFANRGHFFAAAAEAMRRILVEAARRRATRKRGGGARRVELDEAVAAAADSRDDDLLALDEALAELERHDPRAAALVKMRYFSGLTHQQGAEALDVSRRVADRLWAVAKAWLYQRMSGE
jgi:RNA polymerase sigma factor (TIGR02999 family)